MYEDRGIRQAGELPERGGVDTRVINWSNKTVDFPSKQHCRLTVRGVPYTEESYLWAGGRHGAVTVESLHTKMWQKVEKRVCQLRLLLRY